MAGIGTAPCRAMVAEDIRNLQRRARHARRASGGRLVLLDLADEMIERAGDVADRSGGNLRVARCRVELGMSEQHLAVAPSRSTKLSNLFSLRRVGIQPSCKAAV